MWTNETVELYRSVSVPYSRGYSTYSLNFFLDSGQHYENGGYRVGAPPLIPYGWLEDGGVALREAEALATVDPNNGAIWGSFGISGDLFYPYSYDVVEAVKTTVLLAGVRSAHQFQLLFAPFSKCAGDMLGNEYPVRSFYNFLGLTCLIIYIIFSTMWC